MSNDCRSRCWRGGLPLLCLLGLGLMLPMLAGASEQAARQQVDALLQELRARGSEPLVAKRGSTQLGPGEVAKYSLDLNESTTYFIFVAGDETARDLDIGVFDESGNALAMDEEATANAIVQVTPPRTGRYMLLVGNSGTSPGWSHMAVFH